MPEFVKTIQTHCDAFFGENEIRRALNLFYIGSEECGYIDNSGNIQLKNHKNMKELSKVHCNIQADVLIYLEGDLYSDGSIKNIRVNR